MQPESGKINALGKHPVYFKQVVGCNKSQEWYKDLEFRLVWKYISVQILGLGMGLILQVNIYHTCIYTKKYSMNFRANSKIFFGRGGVNKLNNFSLIFETWQQIIHVRILSQVPATRWSFLLTIDLWERLIPTACTHLFLHQILNFELKQQVFYRKIYHLTFCRTYLSFVLWIVTLFVCLYTLESLNKPNLIYNVWVKVVYINQSLCLE